MMASPARFSAAACRCQRAVYVAALLLLPIRRRFTALSAAVAADAAVDILRPCHMFFFFIDDAMSFFHAAADMLLPCLFDMLATPCHMLIDAAAFAFAAAR